MQHDALYYFFLELQENDEAQARQGRSLENALSSSVIERTNGLHIERTGTSLGLSENVRKPTDEGGESTAEAKSRSVCDQYTKGAKVGHICRESSNSRGTSHESITERNL
jgi:hypothetical protein